MDNPSILFCSPQRLRYGWVDLDYLKELHRKGFEVDYTESFKEFTWERVKQYRVLVVYRLPEGDERKAYIETIERFLETGGGVFMMPYINNADEGHRELVEPWGARFPLERYREDDKTRIVPFPNMRWLETMSLVDGIEKSPVTTGVYRLWLPYMDAYNASVSAPISVSKDWQVVVRGSKTSRTEPVDLGKSSMPGPPDPLVRPGGVKQPDLMAIRSWKKGRIFLCVQWSQFSIGQGTKWLYENRVMSRGIRGISSDFGRLVENTFRWLAEPSSGSKDIGGFKIDDLERLEPPNLRPAAREQFHDRFWSKQELDYHRPPRGGKLYRGLIGAQSSLGGGKGSVEQYAKSAAAAGLDYLIFMDEFAALTSEKLKQLEAECQKYSTDKLKLFAGFRMKNNIGNSLFFYGSELTWPRPECLTGPNKKLLNLQYQDELGNFAMRTVALAWILKNYTGPHRQAGYYNFKVEPRSMQIPDLRCYAAAAIRFYRDGKLVEEVIDDYLVAAQGTIPPSPVAVNLVSSPEELKREAKAGRGLTYAQARSFELLMKDALRWSHQYDGINIFTSTGPMIRAWPQCYRVHVFAAEPFATGFNMMPSEVHVTSDVGLKEIRIMNGLQLFRRFLPKGAKEFRQILQLAGNVQRNLVLIAEDINGGSAVSFARRSWKVGALATVFCGDHVNDCSRGYLAVGTGMFQVNRAPEIISGNSWDGGPKGVRPLCQFSEYDPVVKSDAGVEGDRRFNNVPVMEFSDDSATRLRSIRTEVFDKRLRVLNPWHTYGPIDPSRLIDNTLNYTEWNRILAGPHPTAWGALPRRSGATVTLFESHIRFKRSQTVKSLKILRRAWHTNPFPLMLAVERSPDNWEVIDVSGKRPHLRARPTVNMKIATGQAFGFYCPKPSNSSLFINAGKPMLLQINPSNGVQIMLYADLKDSRMDTGDTLVYKLFAVNDPLDQSNRGVVRFTDIRRYLARPEGLKLLRGKQIESNGVFDVEAVNGAVEIHVPRPTEPIGLTIPVRISGLNPNWSAGWLQRKGFSTGFYHDGTNAWCPAGFDLDGRAYAAIFPDTAPETQMVIGHPVVCDQQELFLEAIPRPAKKGDSKSYLWHIAVNNPTDQPITTVLKQAIDVPGLDLPETKITVPAGEYVVIQ